VDEPALGVEQPAGSEGGAAAKADAPVAVEPATETVGAESSDGPPSSRTVPTEQSQAAGSTSIATLDESLEDVSAALQAVVPLGPLPEGGSGPEAGAATLDARPVPLPELGDRAPTAIDAKRVSMLHDVNLRVRIELGRTWMLVEDVLKLGDGSVVELDKLAGDPVDVFVNDRLIARGEVLVLNDNFCVRISEILANDPHRVTL